MTTKQFNNLRVGDTVYSKDGYSGPVSKINRTTRRIDAVGLWNNMCWRYVHVSLPKGKMSMARCGVCSPYHVVEKMEFV